MTNMQNTNNSRRRIMARLRAYGVELLIGFGALACMGGAGLQPMQGFTFKHPLPYTCQQSPDVSSFESPDQYGQFPETVAPPFPGEIQVAKQQESSVPQTVKIRDTEWPLVANQGPSFVYPPQKGKVSYYHECKKIATGERFDPNGMTAAHKTLPFGTLVRCTVEDTGETIDVVINDRGPYVRGRILDLSPAAARKLNLTNRGVAPCKIEVLAYPMIESMGPKGNG